MKYAFNHNAAQTMLELCPPGLNIYEVTYRCIDDNVGVSYCQAETADVAEGRILSYHHVKSAVARTVKEN